jgi:hypothetical protein
MQHLTTVMMALDLLRTPSRVHLVRKAPLPNGVETLLRIAGGDEQLIKDASAAAAVPPRILREAAAFFIEQAMLYPEADAYRVLGTKPGATTAELRRNMAHLLKWLHPDHGGDQRSVFIPYITKAWNSVKSPERRVAYDRLRRLDKADQALARKNGRSRAKTHDTPRYMHSNGSQPGPKRRRSLPPPPPSVFRRMLLLLLGRPVY